MRRWIMTTLAEGREMLLAQYSPENCRDSDYRKRMIAQIMAITTGANPYFTWQELPEEEKAQYGSVEYHPKGVELCLNRWIETGASRIWGQSHTIH